MSGQFLYLELADLMFWLEMWMIYVVISYIFRGLKRVFNSPKGYTTDFIFMSEFGR